MCFSISFSVGSSGSEMFSHAAISVPSPMAAGPDYSLERKTLMPG